MNEQAQRNRTFWQKHWKWLLPIVFLSPIVIMLLTCASFLWSVNKLNESRPAYEMTVEALTNSELVADALGSPLVFDELILGEVRVKDGEGTATLQFGVAGPKGHGLAVSQATETGGVWRVDKLRVEVKAGEQADTTIDVID